MARFGLLCALALATSGCSDDGLAPEAGGADGGTSGGGSSPTSSVNTSATVTASDTSDDSAKFDLPPDADSTGGELETTGFGSEGSSGLGSDGSGEGGTTGGAPEHPCVAGEECPCDPGAVFCEALPPECPPDHVPLVDEGIQCWEGSCVPISSCYSVPECAFCDEDEACVAALDLAGPHYTCQAVDPGCLDLIPTCECMPMACEEPFFECVPVAPGADEDLLCVCPTC